jgi:membrane carboxypeptidase/penicillin-binding protein
MKPFVYLAAFRQGMFDLESMVPDEPISVPDRGKQTTKWISNYDGQFKGMIPLREALAESRNAVAIWIATQIGIGKVLQTARSLGIRTPLQPYATTALGASEVSLLELANAYRTMASGVLAQPHVAIVRGPRNPIIVASRFEEMFRRDFVSLFRNKTRALAMLDRIGFRPVHPESMSRPSPHAGNGA